MSRIEKEKKVIGVMISIYCKKKHHQKVLCTECEDLQNFALKRLSHCRHGDNKTFCSSCSTHCYPPHYKEKIKAVMRFSGPRLIFSHPIMVMDHILESIKHKRQNKKKHNDFTV